MNKRTIKCQFSIFVPPLHLLNLWNTPWHVVERPGDIQMFSLCRRTALWRLCCRSRRLRSRSSSTSPTTNTLMVNEKKREGTIKTKWIEKALPRKRLIRPRIFPYTVFVCLYFKGRNLCVPKKTRNLGHNLCFAVFWTNLSKKLSRIEEKKFVFVWIISGISGTGP